MSTIEKLVPSGMQLATVQGTAFDAGTHGAEKVLAEVASQKVIELVFKPRLAEAVLADEPEAVLADNLSEVVVAAAKAAATNKATAAADPATNATSAAPAKIIEGAASVKHGKANDKKSDQMAIVAADRQSVAAGTIEPRKIAALLAENEELDVDNERLMSSLLQDRFRKLRSFPQNKKLFALIKNAPAAKKVWEIIQSSECDFDSMKAI
jgi:hypothetical protein